MRSKAFKVANVNSPGRWLWYGLTGAGLAIAVVIWALYSPDKYDHKYDGWLQLLILTAGVFGYLLKWGWQYRKRAKFWGFCVVAFVAHCVVFATVLAGMRWSPILLGIVGSFEVMALALLIALGMRKQV